MFRIYSSLLLCLAALPLSLPIGRNLEYEYCTFLGLAAILTLPLITIILKPAQELAWQHAVFTLPGLYLLPGASLHLIQVCPCSSSEFFFWFFTNTYPSLLLGLGLSQALSKRRFRSSLFLSFCLIAIIDLLAQIYLLPQKRINHLLGGFWHGPIYDHEILVDPGILWARLAHTCLALALITKHPWLRLSSLAAYILCWYQALPFPSQGKGQSALHEVLTHAHHHQNFTLYSSQPAAKIAKQVDFHIQELTSKLQINHPPHVQVFVYSNPAQKKRYFGAGWTDVTDVKQISIHISQQNSPQRTLRHELVHALLAPDAFHGLGFHPNMGLTEGLAEAFAPRPKNLSLHQGASILALQKQLPTAQELLSPLFWTKANAKAYTAAGSFISFLVKHSGIHAVKKIYNGAAPQLINKTWEKWHAFLLQQDLSKFKLLGTTLYSEPDWTAQVCLHSKTLLAKSPTPDHPLLKFRQPFGWQTTKFKPWYSQTYAASPQVRLYKLKDQAQNTPQKALIKLQALTQKPPQTWQDLELNLLYSDLLFQVGQDQAGQKALTKLIEISQTQELKASFIRKIHARDYLKHLPKPQQQPWRNYLTGQQPLPELESSPPHPLPWILSYLALRNPKFLINDPVKLLQTQVPPDLPQTFSTQWYDQIALRCWTSNNFHCAAKAWQQIPHPAYQQNARLAKFMQASPN